ncbi:unnamed protein product [Allacma fusca]|uniref:Neprilysin n=1 Tax=Allacma fusca TaxID=39272 RepID=A0A8J2NGP9_9HEXA|nr:unnamed protein product [Allacma fusca]
MTATPEETRQKNYTVYPINGCSSNTPVKWKELTKTERKLYIAIGFLLVIAVGLIIAISIYGIPFLNQKNVCLTEKCVRVAGGILQSMDETVDPCKDFYKFACGRWIRSNPVPESKGSWDQFDILTTQLSRNVKEILERPMDLEDYIRPVAIAKEMYQICMEQENYDGIEDLRRLISSYLSDIDKDYNNLGKTLGKLRRDTADDGNGFLISVYVDLEQVKNDQNVIYVDSPSLSLAQPYFLDGNSTKFKEAYTELIGTLWPIVFPEDKNNTGIADEIVNFSTLLAKSIVRQEDRRNWTKLYNPMKLEQLMNITSQAKMLDWEVTLTEVFENIPEYSKNITNWKDVTIIVRDLSYFENLGQILKDTDPELIKKFLKWCLIFDYAEESSSVLRQVFFQYIQKTKGLKYPEPRWKQCSDWIKDKLGMAVSYHYVRENFDDGAKERVEKMVEDVRNAFYEILTELDWIAEETRIIAEEKAKKMRAFIAYPDFLKNNVSVLLEYYKELKMPGHPSHLRNYLQVISWTSTRLLKEITKPRDATRWRSHAAVVNAYYFSNYNSIYFPAGILQIPFYGYPIEALNYGAIGWVMGHEITHGFDDEGRQTDADGKLSNWWDKWTLEHFSKKAQCFIDQYGNYFAPQANITLNGINNQGENIADNGGMQQAYRAYQYYKSRHGDENRLPGLEYSPEQLFFIAFAQAWCGSYTKESLYSQIMTGAHSPNQFRVQGVLQNSPDFAKTWSCPIATETCRICSLALLVIELLCVQNFENKKKKIPQGELPDA